MIPEIIEMACKIVVKNIVSKVNVMWEVIEMWEAIDIKWISDWNDVRIDHNDIGGDSFDTNEIELIWKSVKLEDVWGERCEAIDKICEMIEWV